MCLFAVQKVAEAPPVWLIAAFAVCFPAFWCLILWMCSRVGGWNMLARRFAAGGRVPQGRGRRVSGKVGQASYGGCLIVEPAAEGFFLSVLLPFRAGHPVLFIPWSAVIARSQKKVLWWRQEVLTIAADSNCTLILPEGVLPSPP